MPEAAVGNRERRDVDPRLIALFGVSLLAFLAVSLLVLRLIFGVPPPPLPFNSGTGIDAANGPVLQTDPKADRAAYDAEKQAELNGLSWVDRSAGTAHIPIADAISIIAAHGLPPFAHADSAVPGSAPPSECSLLQANVPRAPQAAQCPPSTPGGG